MVRLPTIVALSATLALGTAILSTTPASAQSTTTTSTTTSSSSNSNDSTIKLGDKAPNGALTKTHGDWRSSSIVGATVYNDQGDSVGTIDDLLVSTDGSIQNVVISVGGFLGIGSKLVEVPFKNIKFAPSKSNPASGSSQAQTNTASQPAAASATGGAATTASQATANEATGAASPAPAASGMANTTGTGNATGTGNTAPAATPSPAPSSDEYSLVLPGATKSSLTSDSAFHY